MCSKSDISLSGKFCNKFFNCKHITLRWKKCMNSFTSFIILVLCFFGLLAFKKKH